jgi:hypothetical protein
MSQAICDREGRRFSFKAARWTRRGLILALLNVAQVLGVGCAPLMNPPPGFVEVEGERYTFRASSADGLVISVREIEHDPKADLAFWVRAIENELRLGRGYALLTVQDVQTAKGLKGKRLRFGHDEGATPHLYWAVVFVTDGKLYVIEVGGTKELVESNEALLEKAIFDLNAT